MKKVSAQGVWSVLMFALKKAIKVIDSEKCIQCNACHSACQNNAEQVLTKPILLETGMGAR